MLAFAGCNLGLDPSMITGGTGAGGAGGTSQSSSATATSTSTSSGMCGDGACNGTESCKTCAADCGCQMPETCNAMGKCSGCPSTWSAEPASIEAGQGLALDGQGSLYAVGTSTAMALFPQLWAGRYAACDGVPVAEHALPPDLVKFKGGLHGHALALTPSHVLVSGNVLDLNQKDLLGGAVAALDLAGLMPVWSVDAPGAMGLVTPLDLAASTTGWLGTGQTVASQTPHVWLVPGDEKTGQACAVAGSGFGSQTAQAPVAVGDHFVFARVDTVTGKATIQQTDATCVFANNCACPVTKVANLPGNVGAVHQLLVVGTTIYVVGRANQGGFVTSVPYMQAGVLTTWTWHPTMNGTDELTGIATDGAHLFVSGTRAVEVNPITSQGALIELDLQLTAPVWTVEPKNVHVISSVQVDPGAGEGVYYLGSRAPGIVVAKCTKSGTC